MKKYIPIIFFCIVQIFSFAQIKNIQTQVLVVGGSTGGTAAGIQSARSGIQTIIVEQTNMLGGMLTAAGVSCTDGNAALHSGMWQEFREALYKHYHTKNLQTGWVSETCFEPHVADSIFKAWAFSEKKLQIFYGWYFDKVIKKENKIIGAAFINIKNEKLIVTANITIDATDLGDVFANAGCKYDLGTEDSTQSNEKIAPGKTNVIQDITWAAVLKDYGSGADKTIAKPYDYDESKYYCSTKDAPCNTTPYYLDTKKVLDYGRLPNNKFMLNWPAHGNDYYLNVVEMKPIEREKEFIKAKNHTLGFIYFLQTQLGMKQVGFADDELNNGMAFIPYHREGRRVRGMVRLNIDHIKNPYQYDLYKTGIAVGDYPVDHHHAQYPGKVPPIPFPKIPAFNIPLGALIPEDLEGLIVCDKGISVSNIANGTTRLQPVVLLTGQAAGILAAQSVIKNLSPKKINIRTVQQKLLETKNYLMPFYDVQPNDIGWEAIQKMSVLGIFKGIGKSEGWENKMFFYPDSLVRYDELYHSIKDGLFVYPTNRIIRNFDIDRTSNSNFIDEDELNQIIRKINLRFPLSKFDIPIVADSIKSNFRKINLSNKGHYLTRREAAILLDKHCPSLFRLSIINEYGYMY